MKKLSLLAIVVFAAIAATAQTNQTKAERKEEKRKKTQEMIRQAEEGVLVFQKQNIFGVQLRTNGYGAFYELGRMKSNRKANTYRIDIQETKHPKEQKLLNTGFFGNPFVYGKINYFYPITLGFGQQYILGQKGNKNGVAVSAIYNAGLSIGLLRPYYITIDDQGGPRTIKYTQEDSLAFFTASAVQGGAGLSKGWNELKIKPGAFAKVGMRFDSGRFNESVAGVEIGMSLEAYASDVPIMFGQKEQRLFFQGYVAVMFGKRK